MGRTARVEVPRYLPRVAINGSKKSEIASSDLIGRRVVVKKFLVIRVVLGMHQLGRSNAVPSSLGARQRVPYPDELHWFGRRIGIPRDLIGRRSLVEIQSEVVSFPEM